MDSILETQRRLHEERERLIDTMNKEKINSDHRMKILLDRYSDSTGKLMNGYDDGEGQRKEEVSALGGPNEFAEFFNRLKYLKEKHKSNPDEIATPLATEFHEMNELVDDPERVEMEMVEFTDEEGYGRFLDLHAQFAKYINLKGVPKIDYVTYLTSFDGLHEIPKVTKKTGEYKRYLETLIAYLSGFIERTRPLMDLHDEMEKSLMDFKNQWEEGIFPGWPKESSGALTHTGAYLDLSPFTNYQDLMALGLDRLKSALMALGLKCGGTLDERAKRLFETKGKRLEDLPAALFSGGKKKPSAGSTNKAAEKVNSEDHKRFELAAKEAQIYHMAEILSEERSATKDNVERKQARTAGEEEEEEEEVEAKVSDDEADSDVPYNPKNLPLGWDGKPIPYWLYKLHGLNISYSCEICGNQSYKGPKAFQIHFGEWRHSHGMRCLGIPNTAHFANITKISDAIELWTKIREKKEAKRFVPEFEEEFEDSQGNIVNRKTYEDLKRQGLL